MSLILEALRKSEAERRRGEVPGLRAELPPPASPPRAPLRRALPWIASVVAIGIVAAVLVHPWSRGTAPAGSAPVATPPPANGVRLQPRPVPAMQPETTSRVERREPPKPQPTQEPAASTPPPAVATAPEPIAPAATASPSDAGAESSINALPADLRKALPPLQLSMHMWDPDPARRFVILDGERYAEGDSIGPMRIRRIDADGVLFDWEGRLVRLPLR